MDRDLDYYAFECHTANKNWWYVQWTQVGEYSQGVIDYDAEFRMAKIMLMVTELSEATEGVRKGIRDDKLPQYSMESVEMVDALIRILDYCGRFNIPVQEIYEAKMLYNANRADHKMEARNADGGKKI